MAFYYLRLLAAYAHRSAGALRWPRLLLGACGVLLALLAHAQQGPASTSFFADDAGARRAAATSPAAAALTASRALTLDEKGLRVALAAAPLESKGSATKPLVLTLPLPDGTNARFAVREASVMAPALAAKFPEIKTYVGVGIDDAQATVRLDMTPRGFHAQVLSAKTGDFFLDPTSKTDTRHYLSFWKRAMPGRQFECGTKESGALRLDMGKDAAGIAGRTSGPVLRTYRLAMAATAEYTTYQGGTVALGLAAIVTSVNRVVGVYEKEVGVRFVLVDGNDALVYTNAATDPYDNENTNNALLAQNQVNTDALIGTANYDIGHVFSTASGGVAGLGVVCRADRKAQGTTGTRAPVGDAFDIDYVAHEIGHQCGANHTFDSVTGSCGGGNRNAGTAYEPGSGTTIMAYAGICGNTNTQSNSDAYFHVVSYEEILAYLSSTSCATTASTGNAPPSISLPASGLVLPVGTPFKLTANGYDTDGDAITYAWEEFDKTATGGAPTAAQVPGITAPLFRSFSPVPSPTRYFPRLSDLIGNTTTLGERLPTVSRELRFRVTVRDQHSGPQGVIGGVNSSAVVSLSSTSNAGPFLVTAPNTAAAAWASGSTQSVTWDVAGTNANGVNCLAVNIRLSTDGGLTYPTVLLAGAPNNGSATVTVPSVATTTARVMVEAADNYFFDISNADFTITAPATACAAPTGLSVSGITANSASVSFAPSGLATSYVVTTSPATVTQTVTASPVSLTGLAPGVNYTVSIAASCADGTTATTATVGFATSPPPVCADITDLAVSSITSTGATVTFTPTAAVTSYTVTTTPISITQTITGSSVSLTGLQPGTAYTVNIVSDCANGGTTTSTVDFGTIPGNDDCTTAVNLATSSTCVGTSGTITGATQSQPASRCSGATSESAADVWYSFVATAAPLHSVQLTSGFDGVLEVLSGNCGTLATVSCADAVGSGTETVRLTGLTAGTRYYVRVYPYTEDATATITGSFSICVTALTDLIVSDTRAIGGSYRNVTVTSTGAASLSDDLYVNGTMTVQSGGSVRTDAVAYYIRGIGRFVLSAGATLIETNVVGITNTGSGGFFLTGTNPMQLSTDANYVFGGTSLQETGALMPVRARNFTVDNSSGVILTRNLAVARVLRLQDGSLALNGRSLLLPSSAAGTALVDNSGGGAVIGTTASMQRAITGGVAGPAYRHFSSPVATLPFDSLRTGGTVPIVNAAYNTSATPGTTTPYPTAFGYDESRIATTTSNYGDFDKGWFSPASLSEAMQPTKGYTVNIPVGSTPVRFTGTLNTGDQSSGSLTRGASADAGWQLLGNPYPSPLDWSTVTAAQRPGMDAALYVFQSTGQYAGTYRSYVNGVGGTAAQVEAGSGYFVRVSTAGTTGAVNLTNANRVTTFGSQNVFGRTTADLRPQLQLHVASAAGLSDDAYFYVEAGATAGVDAEYDAVKLPNPTGLNLAVLAGATPLAVQGLPTLAGTAEVVLPLTLAVPAAGSFSFEVADLANFGDATVYLRDAATGTQQVLAAGTRYSFTVAAAAATTGRFALVLRPAATQATQSPLAVTQVLVYPNPARVSFTVEVPAVPTATRVDAELLNTLGQVVRRQSAALPSSGAHFTVPTAGLVTGVYMLRLKAGDSTTIKRVVIE